MANFEQKLTAASTEMFKGILEEMQNRKFTSVNFPLLLWGAVDTCEGESVYSALENYLFTLEDCVTPKEIEDTLSDMISDLEPDKKKNPKKLKKVNLMQVPVLATKKQLLLIQPNLVHIRIPLTPAKKLLQTQMENSRNRLATLLLKGSRGHFKTAIMPILRESLK